VVEDGTLAWILWQTVSQFPFQPSLDFRLYQQFPFFCQQNCILPNAYLIYVLKEK